MDNLSTALSWEVINIEREVVSVEKGKYEIENEINILGTHYFMAFDKKAALPFLVGNKRHNNFLIEYDDLTITDSYVDALQEWNDRINEGIAKIKQEQLKFGELSILSKEDVEMIKADTSIKGKLVVIRADYFIHESQFAQKQLYLVDGGCGADGISRGSSVFCSSVYDESRVRFDRKDVLGVLRADRVPAWAKEKVNEIQKSLPNPVTAPAVNKISIRK